MSLANTNPVVPTSVISPMVETIVRYGLNSLFTSLAAAAVGNAAAVPNEVNMAYAVISSVATAGVWVWGIYRSRAAGKMADIAQIKGTTIVTTKELAAKVPANNVVSNEVNDVVNKTGA